MERKLMGYTGKIFELLNKEKIEVNDFIKILRKDDIFEGFLMPRYELSDDSHIVIKLGNGYNIGVKILEGTIIKKIKTKKTFFSQKIIKKEISSLPKISIISTGGTIASRIDYRTGAVHPALSVNDICDTIPELANIATLKLEILFKLLSENIVPKNWVKLAKVISKHIEDGVEGIVVCHGTDTMAYTAAALSFALQNLPIPIILVGSQRSSDRPSSDSAFNLLCAVKAALNLPISEVMVCMHETISDTSVLLHRGTKVRKCHTSRRDAFRSINITPLARIESEKITIISNLYNKREKNKRVILKPKFNERVGLIKFYPGFESKIFNWYIDNKYLGIILEGTGLGHVGKYLFPFIEKAINKDIIIGMTSQCVWGRINMNIYDTGMDLQKIGVIPLADMLPETALVKMMWAFGQTKNKEEVKKILLSNISYEFSSKSEYN